MRLGMGLALLRHRRAPSTIRPRCLPASINFTRTLRFPAASTSNRRIANRSLGCRPRFTGTSAFRERSNHGEEAQDEPDQQRDRTVAKLHRRSSQLTILAEGLRRRLWRRKHRSGVSHADASGDGIQPGRTRRGHRPRPHHGFHAVRAQSAR